MAKRFVLVHDERYEDLKDYDGIVFPTRDKAIQYLKDHGFRHWYRGIWVTDDPRCFDCIEIIMQQTCHMECDA